VKDEDLTMEQRLLLGDLSRFIESETVAQKISINNLLLPDEETEEIMKEQTQNRLLLIEGLDKYIESKINEALIKYTKYYDFKPKAFK
jgi:hypothetical protein